ncbi:MAG: hypothetical protein M1818_006406 [Claussenomyces sp. TS43310]|nr:MAG: hypothetical protein M1818_006406 [Claussenomyces sp. TS43310]
MGSLEEPPNPEVAIPPATTLDRLLTGKLKPLGSLAITSGIIKEARAGRVHVSHLGLADDEHDLTFHGGPDKALHQYCSEHYTFWQAQYPGVETAPRFHGGGFGENLVAAGWSETNVCIGDRVRVGPPGSDTVGGEHGCLLEVSLPRQPCFKLNQRFGIRDIARRVVEVRRSGWYYRVLAEGSIAAGMEVRVVERQHPRWTIERLQYYAHADQANMPVLEELVAIEEMGMECRGMFQSRLKRLIEEQSGDGEGKRKRDVETWRRFRIAEKRRETPRISSFILEALDSQGDEATDINRGSHVRLKLPSGLIRSYSVVSGTTDRIELGIARDPHGRGASLYLCDTAQVDDVLEIGRITQGVPRAPMAAHHIMIAGGIGITAFLHCIRVFERIHFSYEVHYAVRAHDDVAFAAALRDIGPTLTLYDAARGPRLDVGHILRHRRWNSHVYVCGPPRMMDEAARLSRACGMSADEIHLEAFKPAASGDAFTADVEVEGQLLTSSSSPPPPYRRLAVGEAQTLLQVMRAAGLDVPSSCEAGNCGTCVLGLKRGRVEHRGSALTDEERETSMLSCVSRGIGHIVVEVPSW